MNYDGGAHFPLIIELHTVDCGIEQVQLTVASIDRSTDQSSTFIIKPLRQKLVVKFFIFLWILSENSDLFYYNLF